MSRFSLIVFLVLALFSSAAIAATYTLTDSTQISGDFNWNTANANGVVFNPDSGATPSIVGWEKFNQDSLKAMLAQAPDKAKGFIEPMIEQPLEQKAKQREQRIADMNQRIKEPAKASLPKQNIGFRALFSSPLGLFMFFILYCATIFAGYEVAVFRNQPVGLVCGLAAVPFLGVFSPIAFLAMPTNLQIEEPPATQAAVEPAAEAPAHAHAAAAPASAGAQEVSDPLAPPPGAEHGRLHVALEPAAPAPVAVPQPIIFKRGEYSFNRRFFETKLASFFRLVPSEADKDMVVFIKSARGDFAGRRIVNINANDLTLQTFKAEATANEVIPFTDMLEVQLRHKNFA
ncbi:MAG: hypothetical protein JWO95_272 [Verrucomicrobiales bacterium]|nr:hypothetical protein [Verrucomicrobiales bacterium]